MISYYKKSINFSTSTTLIRHFTLMAVKTKSLIVTLVTCGYNDGEGEMHGVAGLEFVRSQ